MERRKIGVTELKVEDLESKKLDVKYEAGGVNWQLFFDGEKSHLIAADYVPTNLLDMEGLYIERGYKKGYSVERGYGDYTVYSKSSRKILLHWMEDSSNWKKFASGILGATATGGPTVEQFCGCWNAMNQHQKEAWIELNNSRKLFVPQKGCWGYWLGSPHRNYTDYVWYARGNGLASLSRYNTPSRGVRPLVTLPADMGLQYDEALGMWLIV